MTTLNAAGAAKITGQDLSRLKKYLTDNLLRALESEGIPVAQRDAFARQVHFRHGHGDTLRNFHDFRRVFDETI